MGCTQTELANVALGHLGEARILNIDEQSPQAEHCRRMWNLTRDGLLRQRHWNFALRLAFLSPLANAPAFGWGWAYQLPEDYLLAVELNSRRGGTSEARFEIIGNQLHCADCEARLQYVRRVEQTSLWDAAFCEAFCLKLASAIAPSITAAPGLAGDLRVEAERIMVKAFGPDNLETRPRAVLAQSASGYLNARFGYSSYPLPETSTEPAKTGPPVKAPAIALVTGSDGAQYTKTTFPDGTVRFQAVYETLP